MNLCLRELRWSVDEELEVVWDGVDELELTVVVA